ncbi:MAG: glycosyltransferase family 39 protein [Candidatus Dormibacteraeota bacterium]|nr:glycosyltransferase family 39 protein [Candidatus Dormibacteraeota bacterium]
MTTATLTLPRLSSRAAAKSERRPRRIHVEGFIVFVLALAFYLAAASYIVFHVHFMINDSLARIDNAFNVLFTRDPHLAAIGFIWPPLPSFLELPIIAFKPLWPALVTQGFAGSIEAAAFSAGTVTLFNSGLRWSGVARPLRWSLCLILAVNPMTVLYAVQGMSEAMLVFFFAASLLVFVRWCESRRPVLLALLGVIAGLGCLTRMEMFAMSAALGVAIIVRSWRAKISWREIETNTLLFGLPAFFVVMLWLGTMTIIMRSPLYFLNAVGSNAEQLAASAAGGTSYTWVSAAGFIGRHALLLFPAVVPVAAIVIVRLARSQRRLNTLLLLALGAPIVLFDTYLIHKHQLVGAMRYQIFVIPYTFVLVVFLLRGLRGRRWLISWLSLSLVGLLGVSDIATTLVLSDRSISFQEAPVMTALANGQTMEQVTAANPDFYVSYGGAAYGADIAQQILKLDKDHGLVACDSLDCFPIVLNVPDPHMFVVSSDRDFEAALGQPQVYHVEYFLVPNPAGADRLLTLYPGLYESGAGFAQLVGTAKSHTGGQDWRLYRIIGPTGRG